MNDVNNPLTVRITTWWFSGTTSPGMFIACFIVQCMGMYLS